MHELGYVEGRDYVIEWRSVEGKYERWPDVVAELAELKVDIIATAVSASLPTLHRMITKIPIVMAYSTDPVGNGLVASLVRPGGNITGLASSSDDSSPKQVELLATVVPNISRVGLLGNPNSTNYLPVLKSAQNAAQKAGLSFVPVEVRSEAMSRGRRAGYGHRLLPIECLIPTPERFDRLCDLCGHHTLSGSP
jgi:putative tryptophan/tyrosine transport system substrate-binding protein